jgi:nucleoside-triphosphatase THEP1
VELGPLELEEKNLNKEIEDLMSQIMVLEQSWLREQNKLVDSVREFQTKQLELRKQNNSFVVLSTKKMRVESKKIFKVYLPFYIKFNIC